jgi:DNA topoisomerase 2-associated protein PAT1
LSEDEMRALTDQGKNNNRGAEQLQTYDHVDADVYDFATLGHELGVSDEQEVDDGLGDQLVEEGDDNNNMTFGDTPVGKLENVL